MAEKIFELERRPGEEYVLHFRPPKSILPASTVEHCRVARKEMLLALRSLIDRAIERTEEGEKAERKGKTKIAVE